jgi:hypothetical protein
VPEPQGAIRSAAESRAGGRRPLDVYLILFALLRGYIYFR